MRARAGLGAQAPTLILATALALVGGWPMIAPAAAAEASLERIDTARGVKQSFILIKPSGPPTAAVVLFAGGHGALGLTSATTMAWGRGNFLVRSRAYFAGQGLLVAVVDAPSDEADGMTAEFRMGRDHARDIAAVVARLRKQADVPVWLVGTSMGTFSAAGAVINGAGADGLVLTSTVTRARSRWKIAGSHPDGVASLPLERVSVPTLILFHANDGCAITPAKDAPKLQRRLSKARKTEVQLLSGGLPARSEPCEAHSEHGFLGIEEEAVGAIARFIKANGRTAQ